MTPRGAAQLIAMRMDGRRPAGDVWVNFGDFREPDWWRFTETSHHPEILIRPEDPIERIDLRCIVGLSVVFFFAEWGDTVARLYERLQDFAAEICVMSPCFESDIGWWWTRKSGQIDFNERWRLTAIEAAQQNCMAAARKGDATAYALWQGRELEAIKGASWLR
jgi:hypothetical protein